MNEEEENTSAEQLGKERKKTRRRIAKRLIAARKERNLSAEDVAGSLRLLPEYLRAFESGDWSGMPEEVYTLGFLRQYAQFIDLDLSDDIECLKSSEYHLSKPITTPDPPVAPNRKWAIISAALFVALFVIINLLTGGDKNKAVSLPVSETPADISNAQKQMPEAPAATEMLPRKPAVPASISMDAATHQYRFTASEKAVWLQVFDVSRKLIREALLQPGESLQLDSNEAALLITCGNSAALQIGIDGVVVQKAGTLGKAGEVLRNYRLTAAPQPTSQP